MANHWPLRWPILLGSLGPGALGFLLPIYGKNIGASAFEIGGLFSVFAIVTLVCQPIVGWGVDRFGRKGFFVASFVGYAVALAAFALANDVAGLFLGRVLQGLASGLMWVSAYSISIDLAPISERGRATGRVDETSSRGQLYGAAAGFALLLWFPLRSGWQVLFIVYALLAAFGAALAVRQTPQTTVYQPLPIERRRTASWPLLHLMIIVTLATLATSMAAPLLIVFLQDKFALGLFSLGLALLPAALVFSFLPSRLGRVSDRFGRIPLMAIGYGAAGAISPFLPSLSSLVWLIGLWTLASLALVAAGPAQSALVGDLGGGEVLGTRYGFYTSATGLGTTLGPALGGWLYDNVGWAAPFYLGGAVLMAIALWITVPPNRRQLTPRRGG